MRPDDGHLRLFRGTAYTLLEDLEPAIADLEVAWARDPESPQIRLLLAKSCNDRAWNLATGPETKRDLDRARELARRAVEVGPGEQVYLNTLGVVLYRSGRYAQALPMLEESLEAGHGQFDAFDLFFLAMAHHRLGHTARARAAFDRAVQWSEERKGVTGEAARELAGFRAEAEAVLARPPGR